MTDQASLSSESQVEDVQVGKVLREARESASYSISYVAAQTHLQEEVIVALENDQYDQLPGEVFVRGYIRSYAKLLDIDPQSLIKDNTVSQLSEEVSPQIKKAKKIKSSGADPVVVWSSVTVVALLVGLIMTWWINQGGEDPVKLASVVETFDDPHHANGVSKQVQQDQIELKQEHQVGLGNIDPNHISDQQNAAPEIISTENEALLEENQSQFVQDFIEAPISGGEIDKVRITVKYTQESWTEIFDARKRRLLHGLIKPGATRVISGQAPFNVFLGNSPGVQLEINGKPFDHSAYVRRNNTARFLIDDINS